MQYWHSDHVKTHEITDDSSFNGDDLANAKSWKEKFDQDLQKEMEQKAQDAKLQNGNFYMQVSNLLLKDIHYLHAWYSFFWNALISIEARKLNLL